MEIRTVLISFMTIIVVGVILLLVYELVFAGGIISRDPVVPVKSTVTLIDALHRGTDYLKIDTKLPPSLNEDGGIEFSYAASIVVNDYDWTSSAEVPIVFVKGTADLSKQSPSVTLKKNTNSLKITQDTYNPNGTPATPGIVTINNLPAAKMVSLVITVKQKSMDVYVNGTLHTHLTLLALPQQNTGSVLVGENGGWNGEIANLVYFNYALTPDEIRLLTNTKPFRNPNDVPPYGPYFNTNWWLSPVN
jgi:hypothetical protein